MTKKEFESILEKVENVEALTEELQNVSDVVETKEILKKYNVDVDFEKIEIMDEELDATELEIVSGGCKCGAPLAHLVHAILRAAGKYATGRDIMGKHC